jgi:hypothetical protein
MSKTALVEAIRRFDVDQVRGILTVKPALKELRLDKGFNLLQFCCARVTAGNRRAADRQLRLARFLVGEGFDPRVIHTTEPGEDGEADPAELSLVWFAVARAQNNRLARYFLQQGARASALFAAAWWGNAGIIRDLVRHGDELDKVAGATALHMAIDVLHRGTEGRPALARQRVGVVEELLRLGANPNVPAVDGTTPLGLALHKDCGVEVFTLLLKHGADPGAPGRDGRTIREIALRKRDRRYARAIEAVARSQGGRRPSGTSSA